MSPAPVASLARRVSRAALLALALALLAPPASALGTLASGGGPLPPYAINLNIDVDVPLDLVGDEEDHASAQVSDEGAGACWEFHATKGYVDVKAEDGGAVVYFPFVGPGGWLPVELPLPGSYRDWGLGTQEAGSSNSC